MIATTTLGVLLDRLEQMAVERHKQEQMRAALVADRDRDRQQIESLATRMIAAQTSIDTLREMATRADHRASGLARSMTVAAPKLRELHAAAEAILPVLAGRATAASRAAARERLSRALLAAADHCDPIPF